MEHHFNVEFASRFGVNEAIFCNNLYFWIVKNRANKKHFHKERYWTYNTMDAFVELFPYWNKRQVEHLINKCREKGLIITDNFNESNTDRTLWYSLTDLSMSVLEPTTEPFHKNEKSKSQKCEIEITNLRNGNHKNVVSTITDNKHTDNKQNHINKNLVNKDVNKNQELIDSIMLEYMKQGLSKELCLRVISQIDFEGIKNLERYLYGVFENVLHKHNLKHDKIEIGSIEGTPLFDWLTK